MTFTDSRFKNILEDEGFDQKNHIAQLERINQNAKELIEFFSKNIWFDISFEEDYTSISWNYRNKLLIIGQNRNSTLYHFLAAPAWLRIDKEHLLFELLQQALRRLKTKDKLKDAS